MAIENAAEGCARETWAAVVATHQSACSSDATLRAVMQRGIAADERRHAALSLELARWLDTRLDADQRLVRSAYADTMAELRRGCRERWSRS